MQETLNDLAAQKKENAETKDDDVTSDFAYRSATREIALNVKVSYNYCSMEKLLKYIQTYYFMNIKNYMTKNIIDDSLIPIFLFYFCIFLFYVFVR